jgi:hypothetical protein
MGHAENMCLYQQQVIEMTAELEILLVVAAPFSLIILKMAVNLPTHRAKNVDTGTV